jgi:hypothetical protein
MNLTPWILASMLWLVPRAPWISTFEDTARDIEQGAREVPVFDGPLAVERTVALDVAVASFESTFEPTALGDCRKLKKNASDPDPPRSKRTEEGCRSHGLYQTDVDLRASALEQTRYANRMLHHSFKVCSKNRFEERLAWYASGGDDGCSSEAGKLASRNRMDLMYRIFLRRPK